MSKIIKIKFRVVNKDIFEAIREGRKKIETRAATEKYRKITAGDVVELVCGRGKFVKEIKKVEIFKTIGALAKKYKPQQINPKTETEKELRDMYGSFPGYKEKIKKYGLVVWKIK